MIMIEDSMIKIGKACIANVVFGTSSERWTVPEYTEESRHSQKQQHGEVGD